jgi:probable phosphoglycerate mutase
VSGKTYIGQLEAPLSERGVEQAWALRNWLEPVEFSRILCSDLTRAQRTAKIITGHRQIPIQVRPELREVNLGDWEGVSFREIARRFPADFEARGKDLENWRPPGGESFADCRNRVLPVLNEVLSNAQGSILLVGHAGVNRLILCAALGIPTANLMCLGQDYGCLNIMEYSGQRCRLQLLNYAPLETRTAMQAAPVDSLRVAGK